MKKSISCLLVLAAVGMASGVNVYAQESPIPKKDTALALPEVQSIQVEQLRKLYENAPSTVMDSFNETIGNSKSINPVSFFMAIDDSLLLNHTASAFIADTHIRNTVMRRLPRQALVDRIRLLCRHQDNSGVGSDVAELARAKNLSALALFAKVSDYRSLARIGLAEDDISRFRDFVTRVSAKPGLPENTLLNPELQLDVATAAVVLVGQDREDNYTVWAGAIDNARKTPGFVIETVPKGFFPRFANGPFGADVLVTIATRLGDGKYTPELAPVLTGLTASKYGLDAFRRVPQKNQLDWIRLFVNDQRKISPDMAGTFAAILVESNIMNKDELMAHFSGKEAKLIADMITAKTRHVSASPLQLAAIAMFALNGPVRTKKEIWHKVKDSFDSNKETISLGSIEDEPKAILFIDELAKTDNGKKILLQEKAQVKNIISKNRPKGIDESERVKRISRVIDDETTWLSPSSHFKASPVDPKKTRR